MSDALQNTSQVLASPALASPYGSHGTPGGTYQEFSKTRPRGSYGSSGTPDPVPHPVPSGSPDGGVPWADPTASPLKSPPQSSRPQRADQRILTPPEREALVTEIRYWTAVHLEMVEAMANGVKLGAEQVQDVRLRLLEEPVTTSTVVEIALIALTLVLEGPIGATVATMATRACLRPVLTGAAAAIVRRTRRPPQVQSLITDLRAEADERIAKALAVAPRPRRRQQKRLTSGANELRTLANQLQSSQREMAQKTAAQARDVLNAMLEITEQNFIPVVKTGIAYGQRPAMYQPPKQDADTLGVEIQVSAAASAARMRLAVQSIGLTLEEAARHPEITVDDARHLLADWMGATELNLDEMRHTFRINAEAMIWARMLSANPGQALFWVDQMEFRNQPRADPDDIPGNVPLIQVTYEAPLLDYLILRFQHEIEEWAAPDPNAGVPGYEVSGATPPTRRGGPREPGWWNRISKWEKADFLAQWFYLILKRLPDDFQVQ